MTTTPATALEPAGASARESERRALSGFELVFLIVLGLLPLFSIAVRILALPGVPCPPALEGLVPIGDRLNQMLSLSDVPLILRNHTIYLLLIPTSAIIVTLARLTLGLPVLAFRSILISVAFHQSGFLASLLLIPLAMGAVLALRPWLRHIELPFYARMAVILSVLAVIMVSVILLAPLMPPDLAWGVIAFPVIALGFLSEGVANAVDRHHFIRAWWIMINTVGIAAVMAVVFWIPALRGFLLRFPEIVLTQCVGTIMIAKFLDFRLFQAWDNQVMRALRSNSLTSRGLHRVAVIRNRLDPATRSRHALRSVQKVVDALRDAGYKVKVMEGDASLPRELRHFFPADERTGERDGIVLNLAQGRGDGGTTHVPAMLELLGLPYTGPTPHGLAVTFDRVAAKVVMQQSGVPTPEFHLVPVRGRIPTSFTYPALVAPRHDLNTRPVLVRDRKQLRAVRRKLRHNGVDELYVEQSLAGRQITAALIGNGSLKCLPLVEVDEDGKRICPARLGRKTARRIGEHARAAFRACGCRDYARVDLRLGPANEVSVLEVRTLGILAAQGTFVLAAREAGYSMADLMTRIVEVTRRRSQARPTQPPPAPRAARSLVHSSDVVGAP